MRSISDYSKKYNKKENDKILHQEFEIALKDETFRKLVSSLKMPDEELMKYTSKLKDTCKELEQCKNCKGLYECNNELKGSITFPSNVNNTLIFSYVCCKYKKEKLKEKRVLYFETPVQLRNASMKDLYIDDKNRINTIKNIKNFINKYSKEDVKGIYLYGSFGSGKSYIISACLNELVKKGYSCINAYFPSLLKTLKEGFNDDTYSSRLEEVMKCDVLAIDDIGSEVNSSFSRDEVLGPILQYRMDNNKATLFTSNFSIDDLEQHLKVTNNGVDAIKARRIIERIKQLTLPCELVSENRRK